MAGRAGGLRCQGQAAWPGKTRNGQKRLAEALRENLRRRKAQARGEGRALRHPGESRDPGRTIPAGLPEVPDRAGMTIRAARSRASSQARASPVELRPDHLQHPGVIVVDPAPLLGRQHRRVDQPAVDRREGEGLEAEHLLLGALDLASARPAPDSRSGCRIRRSCNSRARSRGSCRRWSGSSPPAWLLPTGEIRCGPSCTAR